MMKFSFFFIINLMVSSYIYAQSIGCSDGTYIYTQATGATLDENASNHIPRYNSSARIYMMTYPADQCGYPTNHPVDVPNNTQTLNPNSKCVIGTGGVYGHGLVYYTASLNTCPLDDYLPFLIGSAGIFGLAIIRKRSLQSY